MLSIKNNTAGHNNLEATKPFLGCKSETSRSLSEALCLIVYILYDACRRHHHCHETTAACLNSF